jgi:hypothetical protein
VLALPANKYSLFDRDGPNETVSFLIQLGAPGSKAAHNLQLVPILGLEL